MIIRIAKAVIALLTIGILLGVSWVVGRCDFDPDTGVITSERWRSGVPLGGIGVGKIELLTDGALGYFTINHNWDRPTGVVRGCLAAVFADDGERRAARILRLASEEEYQGVSNVEATQYRGWFPEASVRFSDSALPVSVTAYAWSPLIPHDPKDSSLPVACFEYTLTNPGERPTTAVVALSWENLLGWGGRRGLEWDSVEGNRQREWQRHGLRGLLFTTDQRYEDQRQNVVGEYVLAAEGSPDIEVTALPSWDASGASIPFWAEFAADGSLRAATPERVKRPAGAVAARTQIAPGQSRTLRFWFVWHMPNHITRSTDRGVPLAASWRSLRASSSRSTMTPVVAGAPIDR